MFLLFSVSPTSTRYVSSAGFSLVELLVSIGIIILVLSIVVTQQSSFNSAVLLRSQAYEVALTLREAQLSAVSAVNDASGGGENFRSVIGVHFDLSRPGRYVTFADADGDNFYDSNEEFGPVGLLDPRFEMSAITPSTGGAGFGNDVSITFKRPNFDAQFENTNNTGDTPLGIANVRIDIQPVNGTGVGCPDDVRTIEITSTGQVTVLECP